MEKKWYSLIFSDKFLPAAAGRIKSALMIKIPTQRIESVTTNAVNTANRYSIKRTGILLLFAKARWIAAAFSQLKHSE